MNPCRVRRLPVDTTNVSVCSLVVTCVVAVSQAKSLGPNAGYVGNLPLHAKLRRLKREEQQCCDGETDLLEFLDRSLVDTTAFVDQVTYVYL